MKKIFREFRSCRFFGHDFRYNFPTGSQPYKRICVYCKLKQELDLATDEWNKTFVDKRSDEVLIEKWFKG